MKYKIIKILEKKGIDCNDIVAYSTPKGTEKPIDIDLIETIKEIAEIEIINFAIWLQDNYSQNVSQGIDRHLVKGFMREDFTNNTFPISEIYKEYVKHTS